MAVWDTETLCCFMFLLTGVVGQSVKYPGPVCAVNGSTVTLPCTFTPAKNFTNIKGHVDFLQILRVRWCKNHGVCQGTTPPVVDSDPQNKNNTQFNKPRYKYLGDMKEICTLQISEVQKDDEGVFRFRMEANDTIGHFTGPLGVKITVTERTSLTINSFTNETQLREGQTVTLQCTSICTFHQLKVIWFRDDHALSESGPTLQLGPLTAKDSGIYTCALKHNARSEPYSLFVTEVKGVNGLMVAGVAFGVLLALVFLILVLFIIRRKRTDKDQRAVGDEQELKDPGNIYSSIMDPAELEMRGNPQKTSRAAEEVSYASVQFKPNKQNRREEADDAVIYSFLANKG